jgi:hypothetical protein
MNSSRASQDAVTVGSDNVAMGGSGEPAGIGARYDDQRETEQSRADELSKSKPSIYF